MNPVKRPSSVFYRVLALAICATVLVAVVAVMSGAAPAQSHAASAAASDPQPLVPVQDLGGGPPRPNIVFVLTDDLTWNLVPFMPEVQRMQREGATFSNYFVTSSLCCSSRASIFTGRYPHNTGVLRNTPPHGGWQTFRRTVGDRTFAPELQRSGYRTALLGKFLNGYRAGRGRPQPGWDLWFANGYGYRNFDYAMRERDDSRTGRLASPAGRVARFGSRPKDYLVDVLARRGEAFIHENAQQPFFMELSTFTPHTPAVAAPRDRNRFKHLPLPTGGSFDLQNSDAPRWLAHLPHLRPHRIRALMRLWRKRARSVLAVNDLLRTIRQRLEAEGIADNTYVVFSSDNGYHLGEHRLIYGKRTAFDPDIKVPLVVVGPGVKPGARIPELAGNIDLAPTFLRMASVQPPDDTDGMSLVDLLGGNRPATWRDGLLVEYHQTFPGPFKDPDASDVFVRSPPDYYALRTRKSLYVENATGEREFYDLPHDRFELRNRYRRVGAAARQWLHQRLRALKSCAGASCRAPAPSSAKARSSRVPSGD